MKSDLTPRQEIILNYIRHYINLHGYPPSVRDICKATGLSSSSTVHGHLNSLENKGYIRREPTRSRAIELLATYPGAPKASKTMVSVPLLGKITAGKPILAAENIEDVFSLPAELTGNKEAFILQFKGDSMIEAGILNNDYLIVQSQDSAENGDIVVALLDNKTTIKYFYREQDYIKLVPANSNMQPVCAHEVTIIGKVIGLYRRFL